MLNDNAQKWADALRYGEYEQGQEALFEMTGVNADRPQYCCLGVACDLYAKAHPDKGKWVQSRKWFLMEFVTNSGTSAVGLPLEVSDWLGLARLGKYFPNQYGQFSKLIADNAYDTSVNQTLTTLNDEEHFTFEQIADVIESLPEGLFSDAE